MIINKTIYFNRLKPGRSYCMMPNKMKDLRIELKELNSKISDLKNKLSFNLLPNFESKEKQNSRIEESKKIISKAIEEVEINIRKLVFSEKRLEETVQYYFLNKLKKMVIFYRATQQQHIKKADLTLDSMIEKTVAIEEEELMEMASSQKMSIRNTIFGLTNTLMELKMAIKDQNNSLDRIDRYFEEANMYLDGANKEIYKIPGNYTAFKDKIIYFLLYVILMLLILIFIKEIKRQSKR